MAIMKSRQFFGSAKKRTALRRVLGRPTSLGTLAMIRT
jgi:hypothetical protein